MARTEVAPADLTYEPSPYWAKIPHGISLRGSATSVAVDGQDQVFVFNRGTHPLLVFDSDGNLSHAWDDTSRFERPHSIRIERGDIYLVDDGAHAIHRTTLTGEFQLTVGGGEPAERESGLPFNRPTDVAVHHSTGDLFISDGYGNSRGHRFSGNGQHLHSWGRSGFDPGEFSLPHGLVVTDDGRVLVCDRENFRVQVFDLNGEYVDQWPFHRPYCIAKGVGAVEGLLFIGEGATIVPNRQGVPNLGSRVKVVTDAGVEVARFGGDLPGHAPDQFRGIHGIAVDSRGDVYVAEVPAGWLSTAAQVPPLGQEWVSLRKWSRVR